MKKILFVSVAALVLAAGCSSEPTKTAEATPQTETTTKPTEAPKAETPAALTKDEIEKFMKYAPTIKGGTFLKSAKVENGNQAVIDYYGNFADYKKANPETGLKEEDYKNYFATGDGINTILMEETTRTFKEFPNLNSVNINIPFEGKTHTIEMDKKTAESYYGANFKEMNADQSNEKWKQLRNKFFNKKERESFVQKYIKTK
ncbi:hypothetical protein YDYSY3_10750 [Paenibacillus chitinolyticus]|uniref:hypothetical protein n=1 Tax=Paenibacillus chitinolyticus TaxID=79263 RepID=UPI0026E4C387|nr:hypothetical protein [Paenibacillus chitinolyticus]GKS10075.1 hypothetical protein YDYSY3_10750 [Paenibacillus chitinolyticus]